MANHDERRIIMLDSRAFAEDVARALSELDAENDRHKHASSCAYWLDVLMTSTALLIGTVIGCAVYEKIKDVTSVQLTVASGHFV